MVTEYHFSTCCPFLTDGIKVELIDTAKNIEGEVNINRVVNSNREFLDKWAAIEDIDNCDSKTTIDDLNDLTAQVREVSLYYL